MDYLETKQINSLLKLMEKDCLEFFLKQLKEIVVIPTKQKSDKIYLDFFQFIRKIEGLI